MTSTQTSGSQAALDLVAEIKTSGPGTYTRDGFRIVTDASPDEVVRMMSIVVAKMTGLRVVDAIFEDGTIMMEVAR